MQTDLPPGSDTSEDAEEGIYRRYDFRRWTLRLLRLRRRHSKANRHRGRYQQPPQAQGSLHRECPRTAPKRGRFPNLDCRVYEINRRLISLGRNRLLHRKIHRKMAPACIGVHQLEPPFVRLRNPLCYRKPQSRSAIIS